ncbi:hypothetical protein WR25_04483 [Diploscapter pachys]|uniref:Sugar phosphate transporter domain-containing protein n=1 Tax=Diploscapter pachys TaxID=2018661 RepID=A0A2A2LFK6_9BILA|nr:hypothetical protein WR25_04483 [Diploscapter pachys]
MVDQDKEKLLPSHIFEIERSSRKDVCFKAYVIITMTFLWTGYTLTVRYTRSTVKQDDLYASTTVVLLAEIIKFFITLFMFYRECTYDFKEYKSNIAKYYFGAPKELAKMSVPSIAYALQNNLDFVALSNLDAGLYQVTTQLKVVTTALFMMAFLGRHFSRTRWIAIFMLFAGVAAVQLNNVSNSSSRPHENYFIGIAAVLSTCITAGFAGVYFEKMLKDGGTTPFWIRNMQMYSCGVVSASIACLTENDRLFDKGFFHGYDMKVWAIIGFLSIGGIYISLVMKHLDNLHKSFASAVSIILVVLLSFMLFQGVAIGPFFVLGTTIVVTAVLLYNSVPE